MKSVPALGAPSRHERQPGRHIEFKDAIGIHVTIEQGRECPEVFRGQARHPGGLGEDLLQHQGVDIDETVLQQVQRQYRQFLIVQTIAGYVAPLAIKDEPISTVSVFNDIEPLVDFAS